MLSLFFKRWVNLWKKNPSLKNNKIKWIKGWVIEKNNKIVGHIGHFPMQYFLNKKPYLCSVMYGWAVDKQFRSLSIVLLKRYFSQTYVDFFLATNLNETSSKIMKMLKWKPKTTFKKLVKIMLDEDIRRWSDFIDGKAFPWDAPLYPGEDKFITRLSKGKIR